MVRTSLLASSIALVWTAVAGAQTTERVSLDSAGIQGNGQSYYSSISANGRFVAFSSEASNLVTGDTNVRIDVFVRDVENGATARASVSSSGQEGNGPSGASPPSLSANGRLVAFQSFATNLVPGDTNASLDAFVRDLSSGTTMRVSVGAAGAQGNSDSYQPRLSAGGRFVAFLSAATNLVPNDTNAVYDVFVRDLQLGTTTRASVSSAGTQGNGNSYSPSISADGRWVAFYSNSTNLAPVGSNVWPQIYARDMQAGTTVLVSADPSGMPGLSLSSNCQVSADGRFVVFQSHSSNLVTADTNGVMDIFVRDIQNAITTRVSVDSAGQQADGTSNIYCDSLSPDGRFVAFQSVATNLVPGDTNDVSDVFVRDLQSQTTTRSSVGATGAQASIGSYSASISADGRFVAFESGASNLVAGDTNAFSDVFVRDRAPAPASFCSGDGAGTPCPCGNAGASGHGCASSVQAAGALLSAAGIASVTSDTFLLQGTSMPVGSSALYFQGTAQVNGGNGSVFGDGLRCVGGSVIRLGVEINAQTGSVHPSGGDLPISVKGAVPASGGTRTYQTWYRNNAGPCGSGFNLTNGIQVAWAP